MTKAAPSLRKKEKKIALGFLVYDNFYATIIENILKHYFAEKIQCLVISTSSRTSLYAAFITVRTFLDNKFDHVFIIFNFNAADEDEENIDDLLSIFGEPLKQNHLDRQATLLPIEPPMDLWLLSYFENIDNKKTLPSTEIKKALNAYMTEQDILSSKAFEKIDFNVLRTKNKDFDLFLTKIEEKIKKYSKK